MADINKKPGTGGSRGPANPLQGLRCKPGQLAMVVNPPGVVFPSQHRNLLGMIIRVQKLVLAENGTVPAWTYEGPMILNAHGTALVASISDFVLMPLADGLSEEDEAIECRKAEKAGASSRKAAGVPHA